MAIDQTTTIGADGKRYAQDDPDIPTDSDAQHKRNVQVRGGLPGAGQVLVADGSGSYAAEDRLPATVFVQEDEPDIDVLDIPDDAMWVDITDPAIPLAMKAVAGVWVELEEPAP